MSGDVSGHLTASSTPMAVSPSKTDHPTKRVWSDIAASQSKYVFYYFILLVYHYTNLFKIIN